MSVRIAFCLVLMTVGVGRAADFRTENIVLVTADGLRWQDLFAGMDPLLEAHPKAGMDKAGVVRDRFDAPSAEERRRKLMPFFWTTLAEQGVLLGNRNIGSRVNTLNSHRFSYPGYSEILTGRPQDDIINSNGNRPNPIATVLEILRRELELPRERVALFGSWEVFSGIGASQPNSILINAGYTALDGAGLSDRLQHLSQDQFSLLTPWDTVRHDYSTFEMGLEYMKTVKPRVLYIAFGETDDWAHSRRYDRTMQTANYFDRSVERLWNAIESDAHYRGTTTLILTTDHGRGSTPDDWHGHGDKVEGAEAIWIAAIGPDTPPLGEIESSLAVTQSDIAPTMLKLMGLSPDLLGPGAGEPIQLLAPEAR